MSRRTKKLYTHTNYPVGDFLIRLKNASIADNKTVVAGNTGFIKAVADALKKAGFLESVEVKDKEIHVRLTYRKKEPVLIDVVLVSKPGLRVYMSAEELGKVRSPSVLILSTPEGVLSAKDALKKKIGGEVIAKIL